MNFKQVIYFLDICASGSYTKAAEKNFTVPSAVKKQIASLEEELNIKLFFKTPKGLILSKEGKVFESFAEDSFKLYAKFNFELDKLKRTDESIRIANDTLFPMPFLPEINEEFARHHPNDSQIRVVMSDYDLFINMLRNHEIDCFLTTKPENYLARSLSFILLVDDRFVCIFEAEGLLPQEVKTEKLAKYDLCFKAASFINSVGYRINKNQKKGLKGQTINSCKEIASILNNNKKAVFITSDVFVPEELAAFHKSYISDVFANVGLLCRREDSQRLRPVANASISILKKHISTRFITRQL